MIAACSDCALVDIVCDEQIDTTAYPKLAMSQGLTYADLDLADVPAVSYTHLTLPTKA